MVMTKSVPNRFGYVEQMGDIFIFTPVPTLLHGSEMWVLQKKNERKMNAMKMRSLRRIYEVSLLIESVMKRYTE